MILNLCDYPFTLNNKPYSVAFFIHWLLCVCVCVCRCMCVCVSCSVMSDSMHPPSFSVHGILQARILNGLPCPPPEDPLHPGIEHRFPALQADSTIWWKRQWQPTPVLLPGKSHGWRSLVGCSPWGHKELDTTEWLHFHALEKEMATHSSVLAWRIPGTAEPGGLPSLGLLRVGHDWSDLTAAASIWATREASGCFGQCFIIHLWNNL